MVVITWAGFNTSGMFITFTDADFVFGAIGGTGSGIVVGVVGVVGVVDVVGVVFIVAITIGAGTP
jgi:hypothetical protein